VTLPQSVSAIVLLVFGAGILAVAWHGYRDSVLPQADQRSRCPH